MHRRHLTIRLQLGWLSVATLATFCLVAAFRQDTTPAFRPDAPVDALYLLRAHLVADTIFVVAYGMLLRASIRYGGAHRLASLGIVGLMLADISENILGLTILRGVIVFNTEPPAWQLTSLALAAITKWISAGTVAGLLAVAWWSARRTRAAEARRGERTVAAGGAALFALAAVAAVAALWDVPRAPLQPRAALAAVVAIALALVLQFFTLKITGVMLRFLYLARVPLLILFATYAFGPIALGPGISLLGGILDIGSAWSMGVLVAAGLVLAFACATQTNLVRAYGSQRTFDSTLKVLRHRTLSRAVWWTALGASTALVTSVAIGSSALAPMDVLAGVFGGLIVSILFLYLVELASAWLSDDAAARPLPQLALPFVRFPLLGGWLRDARESPPPLTLAAAKQDAQRWSFARMFGLSSGYVEVDPNGRRRFLPGHVFAFVQLVMSTIFYAALIAGKNIGLPLATETGLWVPTVASIVLLLLLLSWALAGIAFFFDRYRVPLLTSVLGIALITGSRTHTDYAVALEATDPADDYQLVTPAQVLDAFPRPILIAAAGGGIQAGAWTARVLQGMHDEMDGALSDRLALISSVSGGSLAALYYGAYPARPALGTQRAMQPSLDEIASALISADLLRVFGVNAAVDRGEALERSWSSRLPSDAITVRAWAEAAGKRFPAFLFNSTVVETGQPVAFATTQFPTEDYRRSFLPERQQRPVVESVNTLFGLTRDGGRALDVQMRMATGARLSSAFPVVSPAATLAIPQRPRYHLVDGGYYDNYGIVALSQWLDDALQHARAAPDAIDVVIVRGFGAVADDATAPSRGWAWQLVAPPLAYWNTRGFGQWAGGNQVLKLLAEKWAERGVVINIRLIDYPAADLSPVCRVAPLSWKLSSTQQRCIEEGWKIRAAAESRLWRSAP